MTKPNDFTLNSDYLGLVQTNNAEFTAYFPAETFPGNESADRTQDFTVPYSPGAIDTFLVSLNNGSFAIGPRVTIENGSPIMESTVSFFASRISPSTIRVRLHEYNVLSGGYSMPTQTLRFKVTSFIPPNVF